LPDFPLRRVKKPTDKGWFWLFGGIAGIEPASIVAVVGFVGKVGKNIRNYQEKKIIKSKNEERIVELLELAKEQSENHSKYKDPVEELEGYMEKVFSEMNESISFDVFLKRLGEVIDKNTN
jgi:uncharacterized FlaG/YvyC family protein